MGGGGSAGAGFLSKWKQLVFVKGKAGQIISLVEIFFGISQKSEIQDELTPDWGFGGGNHFIAPNLVIFPAFLWCSANSGKCFHASREKAQKFSPVTARHEAAQRSM